MQTPHGLRKARHSAPFQWSDQLTFLWPRRRTPPCSDASNAPDIREGWLAMTEAKHLRRAGSRGTQQGVS